MEGFLKKSLCIAALAGAVGIDAANSVVTLISPRSFGTDGAIRMSADAVKQNLFGKEDCGFWGTISLAGGGGRTFHNHKIARCLFGSDLVSSGSGNCDDSCGESIVVSGSCASDRQSTDWLADYFGLPTDFKSTVTFKPKVTRGFVDFNLYMGLDCWWEGLYATLRVPFEHVRYQLGFKEDVTTAGTNAYAAGYFSEAQVPRTNLLSSFEEFAVDGKVPTLSGVIGGATNSQTARTSSVVFDPLTCAKMYTCKEKTKNEVADLSASLGWNFFMDEDYHLGLYILASAPTGNRPKAEYLFEPISGGGHHWNLGGGLSGHVILWQCDDEESNFGFYVDGSVTHMFKAHQKRFFDLKGLPNSRYMLAEKLTTPVTNLVSGATQGAATAPSAQFANEFTSVANLTCCDVDVSVDVQGQVVAMFNYSTPCFSWDIGYEFWGRSCDKIKMNCNCQCPLDAAPNTWALKGDAFVYGFGATDATTTALQNAPLALSATESDATLHAGTNIPVGTACPALGAVGTANDVRRNPNVDNAQLAWANTTNADDLIVFQPGTPAATANSQQRTSNAPVFLTSDMVDVCGAQSKGLSHTVFSHISYTWNSREGSSCGWDWTPYLGVGGKAEFADSDCNSGCGDSSSNSCSTDCDDDCDDDCKRCNFSQWAVWLKGGIAFD